MQLCFVVYVNHMNYEILNTITDPLYGKVGISNWAQEIIDTRIFNRLRHILQTSFCYLVHGGMTHTRYAHSVGVYILTERIKLRSQYFTEFFAGRQNGEFEKKHLAALALAHDLGHTALSHIMESFGVNHKDLGAKIVLHDSELEQIFRKYNIDREYLAQLMRKEDPLARIVTGGLLSADKLDYLVRDIYFAGDTAFRLDIKSFQKYIEYSVDKGDLYIREEGVGDVIALAMHYLQAYARIYLQPRTLIANRLLHKAIESVFDANAAQREYFFENVGRWTDNGLLHWIQSSNNEQAQKLVRFTEAGKYLFKPVIVVKRQEHLQHAVSDADHKDALFEAAEWKNYLEPFTQLTPMQLTQIERDIAAHIGIPEESIVVAPSMFSERFNAPETLVKVSGIRFLSKSLALATGAEQKEGGIHKLSELRPEIMRAMSQDASRHFAVRIATDAKHATLLRQHADKALAVMFSSMQNIRNQSVIN